MKHLGPALVIAALILSFGHDRLQANDGFTHKTYLLIVANNALLDASPVSAAPEYMTLTWPDVGCMFYPNRTQTGPRDNAAVAATWPDYQQMFGLLEQWGRITGYASVFEVDASWNVITGTLSIESLTSSYKSPEGARQAFEYTVERFLEMNPGETPVSVKQIGDATAAWSHAWTDYEGRTWRSYRLQFRKANIGVTLWTSSVAQGYTSPDETIALAEKIAAKIE
ncbi:MAG: hypothetical protein M1136_01115 [Chloroflexi bacterium]|nr:hypothetical protein [Chloroflexota bacterium]